MNLTDHQWRLLETLLNDEAPQSSRGRPPVNPRPILDAILWKIRHAASWENIPSCYPSHMTCYRRCRIWSRDGRLDRAFFILYKDLSHRGRFDLLRAVGEGAISITFEDHRYRILAAVELVDTWQLSIALVFVQLALNHLKQVSTRTLPTEYPWVSKTTSPRA